MLKFTRETDREIYDIAVAELERQEHNIEMIASESTASLEIMELSGLYSQIRHWKDIRGHVFRQALMKRIDWKSLGLREPRHCLVQSMQIFRYIPGQQQITQYMQQS